MATSVCTAKSVFLQRFCKHLASSIYSHEYTESDSCRLQVCSFPIPKHQVKLSSCSLHSIISNTETPSQTVIMFIAFINFQYRLDNTVQ